MKSKHVYFYLLTAFSVSFLMANRSVSANTALLRGATAIFKKHEVTHTLSLFLGIPKPRLSSMSPRQQGDLLKEEINALRQRGEGELATDIENLFFQLSQGNTGMKGEVKNLLDRMPRDRYSARNILNGDLRTPISERALEVLQTRSGEGEMASSVVEKFSQAVESANSAFGFDVLGKNAASYLGKASLASVGVFVALVSSLGSANALTSTESAFNAMVSQSEIIFGENTISAQNRVCALAEKGLVNASLCMCPICVSMR